MKTWRSSSLYTWVRTGCAATLILECEGVPRDEQMFAVGEVAHLLLDKATIWSAEDPDAFSEHGEKRLRQLANSFMVQVPKWGTQRKPPVGPHQAAEGLRLALQWIRRYGVPEGQSEIGLAVGEDLKTPVPYGSPEARWEGLLDNRFPYEVYDEMTGATLSALTVDDYKSDWPSADPLTLQRKGQAILAIAHVDEMPDRLLLRTLNLRRLKEYPFTTDNVEEDVEQWRQELRQVLDAADKAVEHNTVETAARAGSRCRQCPYLPHCEAGLRYGGALADPEYKLDRMVSDWGSHKALGGMLTQGLMDLLDRNGGVLLTEDNTITRGVKKSRKLHANAILELLEMWSEGADPSAAAQGLLTRLDISVSNVESFISSMGRRDRQVWREWLAAHVEVNIEPSGLSVEDRVPGEGPPDPPVFTPTPKKAKTKAPWQQRDRMLWNAPLDQLPNLRRNA